MYTYRSPCHLSVWKEKFKYDLFTVYLLWLIPDACVGIDGHVMHLGKSWNFH